MRVRFWGTRGSIATPGPGTVRFGGNTACVGVTTSGGACFIFDCGTGARPFGAELMAHTPKPISATILLSHTHWDHIQGFPFFAPLFVPGNQITVCGPEGSGHSLREVLSGQMEFTYFPVEIGQLPATITFRELGEGTHEIGGARIVAQYLHHPAMTLGYRIEADGAAVVYLCDHEPFSETLWHGNPAPSHAESIVHEGDRRHARFMAGTPLAPHSGRDALCGSHILVVDDDPDIRTLVNKALSQDGHIVIEASGGQEALALIDAQAPDLLVLDLLMPKQGGLEVLKVLRSRPSTAALPVLVLTALDDEVNTSAGFDLGATDYLTKPFSIPQLAARVRVCLSRRG